MRRDPVTVRAGQIEFLKLNAGKTEWRDAYHWLLALAWPKFIALVTGIYLGLNFLFATLSLGRGGG